MTSPSGDLPDDERQSDERSAAHRVDPQSDPADERSAAGADAAESGRAAGPSATEGAAAEAPSEGQRPAGASGAEPPMLGRPVDDPGAADAPAEGGRTAGSPTADSPVSRPAPDSATDAPSSARSGASSYGAAAADWPDASTRGADGPSRGADATGGPDASTRGVSGSPERDPFATAPIAAVPRSPEPRAGDAGGSDVRLTKPQPTPRPGGGHPPAPLFGDTPLDEPTGELPGRAAEATYAYSAYGHAAEAAVPAIVDDAPTEAIPVTAPEGGRHRASAQDGADVVTEWRAPRQTSRMTMVLLAALLVALGFFVGVLVGRSAGAHTSSGDNPRPAATAPARPSALR